MKEVLKVLLWLGLGGGIGGFIGYNIADNKRDKEMADCCTECQHNCENCEAKKIYDEAQKEIMEEDRAEGARQEYAGVTVEAATDEEPDMPEEKPEIGDEDIVGNDPAPIIEIIDEDEYYRSDGMEQESLIFYMGDKRLWNQDSRSELKGDEILRSLGATDGNGVGMMYFFRDKDGDIPGEKFVRNNLLAYKFKIDRIDGSFEEEHGEEYDEEDG